MHDGERVVFVAANDAEARIVSGLLTSSGIPNYVFDRSSGQFGAPGHGYDVIVRAEDAPSARALLEPTGVDQPDEGP